MGMRGERGATWRAENRGCIVVVRGACNEALVESTQTLLSTPRRAGGLPTNSVDGFTFLACV